MSTSITHIDWLARNAMRSYPLAPQGPGDVPVDLLVDASVVGPLSGGLFLKTLSVTLQTATAVLADSSGTVVGYATATLSEDTYQAIAITPTVDGCAGTVTFGPLLRQNDPLYDLTDHLGVRNYADGAAAFAQRCSMDTGSPPIHSFDVENREGRASGAITLDLGPGMSFTTAEETLATGEKVTRVTLTLDDPAEFLPECEPKSTDPLVACGEVFIKRINGVSRNPEDLGIDIVFKSQPFLPLGEIVAVPDRNTVEVSYTRLGSEVCSEDPALPDKHGRLPELYDLDCPPDTPYGTDPGPACINEEDPFLTPSNETTEGTD